MQFAFAAICVPAWVSGVFLQVCRLYCLPCLPLLFIFLLYLCSGFPSWEVNYHVFAQSSRQLFGGYFFLITFAILQTRCVLVG